MHSATSARAKLKFAESAAVGKGAFEGLLLDTAIGDGVARGARLVAAGRFAGANVQGAATRWRAQRARCDITAARALASGNVGWGPRPPEAWPRPVVMFDTQAWHEFKESQARQRVAPHVLTRRCAPGYQTTMLHDSQRLPAWVEADAIDSNLLVRLGIGLAQFASECRIPDSAALVGIGQEAAELFQLFHYSFDPVYWDARDYPNVVAEFISEIVGVLNMEPNWIESRYCAGRETLIDLLRRHQVTSEAPEFMPR